MEWSLRETRGGTVLVVCLSLRLFKNKVSEKKNLPLLYCTTCLLSVPTALPPSVRYLHIRMDAYRRSKPKRSPKRSLRGK